VDLGYEPEDVRRVLEHILPAGQPAPCSPVKRPAPEATLRPGDGASEEGSPRKESDCDAIGGNGEALHVATGKFRLQVFERLRRQLLERYLSLHDAFARLNLEAHRDRNLTRKEFRLALETLGVGEEDEEELFVAMDTQDVGGVNIACFLHALVDVSPEALLWELRCKFVRMNIGLHNLHKAMDLVQWPQHGWQSRATKVKRRQTRRSPSNCSGFGQSRPDSAFSESDGQRAAETRPTRYHLTRSDWLKLCTSMCMTLLEAERLFTILADRRRSVDLRAVFETLRTTVEPDISLERFVAKVLQQYGTLENAFKAFVEDRSYLPNRPEPLMWWEQFHRMLVALNISDKNAAEIWTKLTGSLEGNDDASEEEKVGTAIAASAFLRELSLWAPDNALGVLKDRLAVRFGSLAEGHRMLQRSFPKEEKELHPGDLDARLRAAGIKNCNSVVRQALSSVESQKGFVTLSTTIDSMKDIDRHGRKALAHSESEIAAHVAVRSQTQRCWAKIQSVQSDCLRRHVSDDDGGAAPAVGPSSAAAWPATARQASAPAAQKASTPQAADSQGFAQAIHGAVRGTKSVHQKSMLQQAHRQVMELEKRWASPSQGDKSAGGRSPQAPGRRGARRSSCSSVGGLRRNRSCPGGLLVTAC